MLAGNDLTQALQVRQIEPSMIVARHFADRSVLPDERGSQPPACSHDHNLQVCFHKMEKERVTIIHPRHRADKQEITLRESNSLSRRRFVSLDTWPNIS